MTAKKHVLLLNSSEEILNVISWRKAVHLLVNNKAFKPFGHEEFYVIKTNRGDYILPTAIVLVSYVRIPTKKLHPTKKNILKRDNNECQYCGNKLGPGKESTIDHIVPKSKGGKHEWTNVVASCIRCNSKKSDKPLEKTGMKLRKEPTAPSKKAMLFTIIENVSKESWDRWVYT